MREEEEGQQDGRTVKGEVGTESDGGKAGKEAAKLENDRQQRRPRMPVWINDPREPDCY